NTPRGKSGKRKAETPSPGLAATLSHRMGEGLGEAGSFACRFMAPIRVHSRWKLSMNLRHSNFGIRHSAFRTGSSNAECRMSWVHGPNARPQVGGRGYP